MSDLKEYPQGRFKVTFHPRDIQLKDFAGLRHMRSPDMRLVYRWVFWFGPLTIFRWSSMSEALASVEARKVVPTVEP